MEAPIKPEHLKLFHSGEMSSNSFFKKCYMEIPLPVLKQLMVDTTRNIVERAIRLDVEHNIYKIIKYCGIYVENIEHPGSGSFFVPSKTNDRFYLGSFKAMGFEHFDEELSAVAVVDIIISNGIPEDIIKREIQKVSPLFVDSRHEIPKEDCESDVTIADGFLPQDKLSLTVQPKDLTPLAEGVNQKSDIENTKNTENEKASKVQSEDSSEKMTPENDKKNEKVSKKPWTRDEEEKFKKLKKAGFSYDNISQQMGRSIDSLKQKSKYMDLDDEELPAEQAAGVADSINKLNLPDDSKITGNINIVKHLNTLLFRDSEVLDGVWKELREGKIPYTTYLRVSNRSLSNLTKGNFLKIIIAEGKSIAMNDIKQKIISVMKDVMINMPEEARIKFKEALDAGIDELNKNITNESLQDDPEDTDDEEQEEE